MDELQVAIWLPEKIGQSARPADINHTATKKDLTEDKVKNNVRRDGMNRLMHRLLIHLVDIMCGKDVSHTKTEGERHQITMSHVTAAISVSLVGPLSPNFGLTHLPG